MKPALKSASSQEAGFTLVELVIVLSLVGVLAIVAVVKLGSYNSFDLHVAAERLRSDLAKAQLLAVSNSARVRLSPGTNGYSVEQENCSLDSTCSWQVVINPSTTRPFQVVLPSGTQLSASTFYFNTWGIPSTVSGSAISSALTFVLSRAGADVSVNVRPVTGASFVVR